MGQRSKPRHPCAVIASLAVVLVLGNRWEIAGGEARAYVQGACFTPPSHSSAGIERTERVEVQRELRKQKIAQRVVEDTAGFVPVDRRFERQKAARLTIDGITGRELRLTDLDYLADNTSYHRVPGVADRLRQTWRAIYAAAHPEEPDPITMVTVGTKRFPSMITISDQRCMTM